MSENRVVHIDNLELAREAFTAELVDREREIIRLRAAVSTERTRRFLLLNELVGYFAERDPGGHGRLKRDFQEFRKKVRGGTPGRRFEDVKEEDVLAAVSARSDPEPKP